MAYLEIVIELVNVPHVALNFLIIVFGVFGNGVVGEVGVLVADFRVFVVLSSESDVALLIEPDCQGIPVGDQYPLPDVEL